MAGPFLTTLGRSARAFLPVARAGVAQGLSMTRTINAYRLAGNRIANDAARAVFRTVLAHERAAATVQTITRNRPIPAKLLPQALTKIRRKYSFTVEVSGFLTETGAATKRVITISTDTTMTPRQIEDLAMETVHDGGERYGMEVEEVKLVRGIRAGAFGTFS